VTLNATLILLSAGLLIVLFISWVAVVTLSPGKPIHWDNMTFHSCMSSWHLTMEIFDCLMCGCGEFQVLNVETLKAC